MPLIDKINHNDETIIYIWKITEDLESLLAELPLRSESKKRLKNMKSLQHQKGFLSIRHLLKQAGYSDFDLFYDANGKPYLKDGMHISITHSFEFSAIAIGKNNVGIDIEKQREKICRISDKFVNPKEQLYLSEDFNEKIRELTVVWGTKESIYKMCNSRSLSFKDNMNVDAFTLGCFKGKASVCDADFMLNFIFYFKEIEGFTLVYTIESN